MPLPPPPPPPKASAPPPPPIVNGSPQLRKITLAADLVLTVEHIAGKSMAVLGTTGSGKSTTTRKVLEEFIRVGVPFTVADIENEYAALKELGEVILAGTTGDFGRIKLNILLENEKEAYKLGRDAYLKGLSVILLLGELEDSVRKLFLQAYITGMFEAASNPDTRKSHKLVLEEIQEYVPQTGLSKEDPLRLTILRVAKRGRKRGIDLLPVSQRPANVDKDVLTQCQIFWAHYVTYPTDIDTYKKILKIDDLDARLQVMKPGDVIFQNGKDVKFVSILHPKTASPSTTPGAVHVEQFKSVSHITEDLQEQMRNVEDREGTSVVPTAYLRQLEEKVPKLEGELNAASTSLEVLEQKIIELEASLPDDPTERGMMLKIAELVKQLGEVTTERDQLKAENQPIALIVQHIISKIGAKA